MRQQKNILSALVLSLSVNSLCAQDIPMHRNIIKMSPFHFLDRTFQMSYEHFSADYKKSFMLSAGLTTELNDRETLLGINAELQYRIYLSESVIMGKRGRGNLVMKGVYVSPYAFFRYTSHEWESTVWNEVCLVDSLYGYYTYCADSGRYDYWRKYSTYSTVRRRQYVPSYAGGVLLGIQWMLFKALYIDIYMGGGIKYSDVPKHDPNEYYFYDESIWDYGYSGVLPKMGFQLGIGF